MSQGLSEIFAPDAFLTDSESLKTYGRDWTTYFDIKASAVVFPQNTAQVRDLVLWARKTKTALVPSGGRTGLSGAACALNGEVVVSFDRMNKILDFDPFDAMVRIQPGVVTEDLQRFAQERGLFYPVDFAARGSSQMGGNIATNAGGIRVIKYGMTRSWVTGLEVVTGSGDIMKLNKGLIKNATGPDFRNLFVGSEGTLGFITEATIQLAKAPAPSKVMLLGLPNLENVMNVLKLYSESSTLTAFEMFSQQCLNYVLEKTGLPAPLGTATPFYVVLEAECPHEVAETEIMGAFEKALDQNWVVDGLIAQSEPQAKAMWRYREDISESISSRSPYKNDISVRPSKVPQFMLGLEKILKTSYPTWEVLWFGHIGDGNLHINILRPAEMTKEVFVKECRKVDEMVFQVVADCDGSISAEHGVGLTKKDYLKFTRSPAEIEILRKIKAAFDPDGIMNPGKII